MGYSFQSGSKTFIVTLLTGSDMSVLINSGPKRKDYSDHSSYFYSGIGPKERALSDLENLQKSENCELKSVNWYRLQLIINSEI